jgi:competence protein ComGC
LKKVMLLAAMLAMVLAAAVPALAQSVTQVGEGNVACVQTAVQQQVANTQVTEDGDNLNVQNISQECNIAVEQVTEVVHEDVKVVHKAGKVVPLKVVHKAGKVEVVAADVQYSATATATATASASSAPAAVQYQYSAPTASASASASSAAVELPPTGGSSLIALGAGVLLVAGGLLARRIVR